MESQLIESEFEIQNEGNVEIISESFEVNMDSQIEMQMTGEQQIGSLQTSSGGMAILMQSDGNVEQQFYIQDGSFMQVSSQGLTNDLQAQGFSQIVEREQFAGYEGSSVTQEIQNVQISEMSAEGTMQLSGQEIYYEGGFISEAATGCGEGQVLEMTMQGMEPIEAQSGGIMKQEMQLEMNGQMIEMKEISMEGGVMASHEMSVGMIAEQKMQLQNLQGESADGVFYLDNGEVQESGIVIPEMSLEMGGTQMHMQEMNEGISLIEEEGLQMNETITQEGSFVEEGEIQMNLMSMQETGCVELREMGMTQMSLEMNGTEMQIQEMSLQDGQEINFSQGGELQSEMAIQETGMVEIGGIEITEIPIEGIQGEQLQMSEMAMGEISLDVTGSQMQMQDMSLKIQSQEIGFVTEGELHLSQTTIEEVGFVEEEEIQTSDMSMSAMTLEMGPPEMEMQGMAMQEMLGEVPIQEFGPEEGYNIHIEEMAMSETTLEIIGQDSQLQEVAIQEIPQAEGELQMSETVIQEVGFVESGENQLSEMSMSEMTFEMSSQEMLPQEETIQEVPLAKGELQMSETVIQEVGFVESGENQLSETIEEVGFVEGEEIQTKDMSMSAMTLEMGPPEIEMQGMAMQEMLGEVPIQEFGPEEGYNIHIEEMAMSETTLKIIGQDSQLQEVAIQEIPQEEGELQMSETLIQEVGFVESGENQLSEMSMSEMTFEMSSQEMLSQGETTQKIPLVEGELQTSETAIQEVGFVESGENQLSETIEEVGFVEGEEIQTSEMSMSEMTLEMGPPEIEMQGMAMQEMLGEVPIQEFGPVEGDNIHIDEMAMSETTLEIPGQDMQMQEVAIQEIPQGEDIKASEMSMSMSETNFETSCQELLIQEVSAKNVRLEKEEFQANETMINEVEFTEREVQASEISMSEMTLEISGQEMLLQQDVSVEKILLKEDELQTNEKVMIQEKGIAEGGQIQTSEMSWSEISLEISEQQVEMQEVSIQEVPSEMKEVTIQEMPLQVVPFKIKDKSVEEMPESAPEKLAEKQEQGLQDSSIQETSEETSGTEIPFEMQDESTSTTSTEIKESSEVNEGELQRNKMAVQQMPSKPQQIEITKLASQGQAMPEQSVNEMLIKEIPMVTTGQEVRILSAEMTIEEFPIDTTCHVVQEIESSESQSSEENPAIEQTKETVATTDSVSKEKAQEVEPEARGEGKRSKGLPVKESVVEKNSVTTQEALSTYTKTGLVDSTTLESKEHENVKEIVIEKVTCEHQLLIDQFLERISRLEKDKEYLERCYEELREMKEIDITSREEQYTSRSEDHHHSCDIVKDYSTTVEYIASPREQQRRMFSYVHCPNSFAHDSRESTLFSNMSDDHEYYKAKCEQIKHEKERLERAYETEKRQREELERDYRNETNEKNYLEERYQEMSDSINRFEETIRSLRRDNEVLQKNLNDWANARVMPPTFEISGMVLENNQVEGDVEEYKRSIQALEKENREFRTILDVLSKKNESQESLKTIELGLARENEFVELKRERARLESSIKEMKRTNTYLQERIEEIRRESTGEISRLNEKQRKLERTLKEKERAIQEKDEEFGNLKKRHLDEIQAMETRFHNDLSKEIIANNQMKDLQAKIRQMEEERSMLKEELRSSSLISRDRHSGMDMEQDAGVVRQRYEEERRSKVRLASDMKCLLSDIMELKERNLRLQEDFNRERMEIKGMIERQANEITQEYITQISKLQKSLIEETKRRQEAEASAFGAINNHYNGSSPSSGQKGTSVKAGWGKSDMQQELNDEIQRRESLEIENKKLLYKINEILSGEGNCVNETAFDDEKFERTSLSRNKRNASSWGNKGRDKEHKQTALLNEIEDLQEKLEDMMKDAKRNKALKRRNEDLEEEVIHLTRKRDELLASQRNLTREVDHLSRTLEEVERRNRKLTDDSERFTRRIQDIEDTFRQEKITLTRHYEKEKATALEEVIKLKEACESKLQIQKDATKALEEKVRLLEVQGLGHTEGMGASLSPHSTAVDTRNVSDNSKTEGKQSQEEKLKQEVQRLEAMLRDVNKKHADEIRNLDIQREQMSKEFRREKQALKRYFDMDSKSLQTRLSDVEETLQGRRAREEEFEQGGEIIYGDSEIVSQGTRIQRGCKSIDTEEAVITTSGQWPSFAGRPDNVNPVSLDQGAFTSTELGEIAPVQHGSSSTEHGDRFSRILGSHSPIFERKTNVDQMYQIQHEVNFTESGEMSCEPTLLSSEPRDTGEMRPTKRQCNATTDHRESPGQGDFDKRAQELQRRFNDEKRDMLNRANREKAKLEEEVRETKEKLTSYRRLLEEEIADIKKKHRKEVDFLNDRLQKERAESDEKLRIHRNAMAREGSSPESQSTHYLSEEMVNVASNGGIVTQEQEHKNKILTSKLEKEKSQFENEKKKLTHTIHALRNEINILRNEKRDCKECYKQEIEKLRRIHEVEKVTLLRRSTRDKDEEIARIRENFEERLSTERKKSQTIIDDLRRKISSMERKVKDLETHQTNERLKLEEEKMAAEKRLIQTREDLKVALDRDYRKMLSDQKLKFDQTVKGLTKQISYLQEQRKQIQEKMLNNELSAKSLVNIGQPSKGNVIFQMEQEFLERASRERRPMEEKIGELQQEISRLKREKNELKETMETEKRELEEDLEKLQEDTRRKVSKAREEMERRIETMTKTVMASRVKSVQHSPNCEVQQYKDQINSMEQRNLTLKAKTERLERELRFMGERLQTLETRNKDLEASEGGIRDDMLRSNNGYRGDPINREVSGYFLGYNATGPRSENGISEMQARYSSGLNNTSGQTVLGTGESYKDILERVRHTMHTTGSISDALGTSTNVSGGPSNIHVVGSTNYGPLRGDNIVSGPLNHTSVGTQGSGIISGARYTGLNNVRFISGQVNGNALQDVTRNAPYYVEGTEQPETRP